MVLYQPESGYCFNSDTIFLFDFIMRFAPKGRVLDVGAGCGVLGLLVAQYSKIELYGVEKQAAFIPYIQKNVAYNSIDYELFFQEYQTIPQEIKYDFIISNPPFYHDGVQKSENEIIHQARYNTHLPLKEFIQTTKRVLKPRGHFIFCYDPSQMGLIAKELADAKLKICDIRYVHPKIDKKASLVMIHARSSSSSYAIIHPPLIVFENGKFSKEVEEIYKKANTESIKCKI